MGYVIEKKTSVKDKIAYLPEEIILPKTSEKFILDFYRDSDYKIVFQMLKSVVEEGLSYPQETMNEKYFDDYYLSHDVFVMRDEKNGEVVGSFNVKPNFPGRSSHICKAGFLVNVKHRKKGIGEVLFKKYLTIARDLGYECSLNLVYATNEASVRIFRKLGFKEIGRIPKTGKLKGLGYDVDALQFYYDLTTWQNAD